MDNKEFTLWGSLIFGFVLICVIALTLFHIRNMECIRSGYSQEIVPTDYVKIWVRR